MSEINYIVCDQCYNKTEFGSLFCFSCGNKINIFQNKTNDLAFELAKSRLVENLLSGIKRDKSTLYFYIIAFFYIMIGLIFLTISYK